MYKIPNTQVKFLTLFSSLSQKVTKREDLPHLIYAFINKMRPEDGIRIGMTATALQTRIDRYKTASNAKKNEGFALYEDIKLQGIDDFEMILLDIQIGESNALKSEKFFTIYFNRDGKAKYGYDLNVNRKYNPIVGNLYSLSGDEHPGYIEGIHFDDINSLIETGYEMKDLTAIYGVVRKTINTRIKQWYSDKFGESVGYNTISKYLRTRKLIEYYSQGLMAHEIAKKFVKFDKVLNPSFSTAKEGNELYKAGNLEIIHYSTRTINQWTRKNLGLSSSEAYERYYVKPILMSLLQLGYHQQEAAEVLEAMGITNPNKVGTPYSSQALGRLVEERLWGSAGEIWKDMRKILMEPIIETLIRGGLTQTEIALKLQRSTGFIARFIKSVWKFADFEAARDFFYIKDRYLKHHRADSYI